MDSPDEMVRTKTEFYEAASRVFKHVNDRNVGLFGRSDLNIAADNYLQALLDLSASIPTDTKYRQAIRKTADRLRPFLFELDQTIEYHREKEGLDSEEI